MTRPFDPDSKGQNPADRKGLRHKNKLASSTTAQTLKKTSSEDTPTRPPSLATVPKELHKHSQESKTVNRSKRAADVKFRTSASGRLQLDAMAADELQRTRVLLRDVFAPGTPVQSKEYLAGRLVELEQIISSIEDKRAHVVVYGHRGWGKTSLVNTVAEIAQEAGYIVVKASCGAYASFSQMFRSFLSEIPLLYHRDVVSKHAIDEFRAEFDRFLPEGDFSAKELTDVMERVCTTRIVMILDEYDRIENEEFKLAITETIKNFSDRSIRAQLLIVGVADTLNQLVGLNPSIRRNISGVQLRLLTDNEVIEMMCIGKEVSGVAFDSEAQTHILRLSRHTPYNVKLLLLHASQMALLHGRLEVTKQDVIGAAKRAIIESESLITSDLLDLLGNARNGAKKKLLYAMAGAKTNSIDEVNLDSVIKALAEFDEGNASALSVGKRIATFTKGPNPLIRMRKVSGRSFYSFNDSLMAFFLRLKSELSRLP